MIRDNSRDKVEVVIRRIYYNSGAIYRETPYVNGKIHGLTKKYYKAGVICSEIPYVNGEIHGIVKHFNREKSNIDCLTLYNKDRILLSLCCEN